MTGVPRPVRLLTDDNSPGGARAMTPERRKLVNRIFEAAVERPPSERSAYLDGACAGDPSLRAEVESLIARRSGSEAAESAESPESAESDAPGAAGGGAGRAVAGRRGEVVPGRTTLGSYRILE